MLTKGMLLKGLLVKKVVVAGAAALVTVTAVETAVKVSADRYAAAPAESSVTASLAAGEDTQDPAAALLTAEPAEGEAETGGEPASASSESRASAASATPAQTPAPAALPGAAVSAAQTAALQADAEAEAEALEGALPGAAALETPAPGTPAQAAAAPVSSAAAPTPSAPVQAAAPAPEPAAAAAPAPAPEAADNRHTTSIYEDGNLIRQEYYNEDNHLYEYSDVTNYDKETGSYTETVYQYDEETETEHVVRTDTYVNGELASSEQP